MKALLSVIAFVLLSVAYWAQGVGVNETGADPHPSAMLDVNSNSKGLLAPRMTMAERDAISSPADGLIIFNTTTNCLNYRVGSVWYDVCGTLPLGTIATLECGGATNNGTLTSGLAASSVNSVVSYTGGNGGTHSGQSVTSTGVTGLTATLGAGTFAPGAGTLTYTITGTPGAAGTASFELNIGGQICTLSRTVAPPPFICGSSTVTFTYRGSSVTYGTVQRAYGGTVGTKCWLDRNLGATQVATSSTHTNSYGDLFQWGRGDDGHQVRSPLSATSGTQSSSTSPGSTFIVGHTNWYNGSNPASLWQGESGINNPCPSGWRVPTEGELDAERASWGSNSLSGAIASPLKMPANGRRNNLGELINVGVMGYYWSSQVSGSTNAILLLIQSSNANMGGSSRADGMAVRCVKD